MESSWIEESDKVQCSVHMCAGLTQLMRIKFGVSPVAHHLKGAQDFPPQGCCSHPQHSQKRLFWRYRQILHFIQS